MSSNFTGKPTEGSSYLWLEKATALYRMLSGKKKARRILSRFRDPADYIADEVWHRKFRHFSVNKKKKNVNKSYKQKINIQKMPPPRWRGREPLRTTTRCKSNELQLAQFITESV